MIQQVSFHKCKHLSELVYTLTMKSSQQDVIILCCGPKSICFESFQAVYNWLLRNSAVNRMDAMGLTLYPKTPSMFVSMLDMERDF